MHLDPVTSLQLGIWFLRPVRVIWKINHKGLVANISGDPFPGVLRVNLPIRTFDWGSDPHLIRPALAIHLEGQHRELQQTPEGRG